MTISVNTLVTELREHTGLDLTDLPDPDAILLLNRSWWEIMDLFEFREKEQTFVFNTVNGTRSYNVPSLFDAMQSLSIEDSNKSHKGLDPIDPQVYENEYVDDTDANAMPIRYYREGSTVVLYPTPDDIYEITMKYLTTLADLAAGAVPAIPKSWHEIILFGGVYRAHMRAGEMQKASWYRKNQADMMNNRVPTKSKEEVDSRHWGLQVLTKAPTQEVTSGRLIN